GRGAVGADPTGRGRGRRPVHPAPGRVRPGLDLRAGHPARRRRRPGRGQVVVGPARAAHPRHRRRHRPGLLRARHAGAVQRGDAADQALAGDEDRPAVLLPAHLAGRARLRLGPVRLALPGSAGTDAEPVAPELPPHQDLTPAAGRADQSSARKTLISPDAVRQRTVTYGLPSCGCWLVSRSIRMSPFTVFRSSQAGSPSAMPTAIEPEAERRSTEPVVEVALMSPDPVDTLSVPERSRLSRTSPDPDFAVTGPADSRSAMSPDPVENSAASVTVPAAMSPEPVLAESTRAVPTVRSPEPEVIRPLPSSALITTSPDRVVTSTSRPAGTSRNTSGSRSPAQARSTVIISRSSRCSTRSGWFGSQPSTVQFTCSAFEPVLIRTSPPYSCTEIERIPR